MKNYQSSKHDLVLFSEITEAAKNDGVFPKGVPATLSIVVRELFGVTSKRIRKPAIGGKAGTRGVLHTVFIGIEKIEQENRRQHDYEPVNIKTISLPNDIAVKVSSNFIALHCATDYTIDDVPVGKIARIYDKHWELYVNERMVKLEKYNIDKAYDGTKKGFHDIMNIIKKTKVCVGRAVPESEQVINSMSTAHKISDVTASHSTKTIRSTCCHGVISWLATASHCRVCQTLTKLKKPFAPIAPTENNDDNVDLVEEDHQDMVDLLGKIFKDAKPEMKIFIQAQLDALKAKPHGRRWPREVISTWLSIWLRSPGAYAELRTSDVALLPSGRQLRRYKNTIHQTPGINKEIMTWMYHAAKSANLPDFGWSGGLVHDEMSIQQDLVLSKRGGKVQLVGFVDTGDEGNLLRTLKTGEQTQSLAHEVVQIIFQGYSGFRFPLFHYPTAGVKASELYIMINSTIAILHDYGFHIDYVMQDGGQGNRNYTSIVTDLNRKFVVANPLTDQSAFVLCQDYAHNMKKIRNNLLKSGKPGGAKITRQIQLDNCDVVWDHWKAAVNWDREREGVGRKIHYKVTKAHLEPSTSEKMRNHLAEDMLNGEMLHLMECYQASLPEGAHLNGSILLLRKTSQMVAIFNDRRQIKSLKDERLAQLDSLFQWIREWKASSKAINIFSQQCCEDVMAMLTNLPEVAKLHLVRFPHGGITPAMFNSNSIENFFCQQRGLNGNNTNPNYASYCHTVNSIILSQPLKCRARSSNAGLQKAEPYKFYSTAPPKVIYCLHTCL